MTTRANIPQLIALTLLAANGSGCIFFCGDSKTEKAVNVADWNVDMARYDGIVDASNNSSNNSSETGTDSDSGGYTGTGGYTYSSTPWDERDDASRCRFACAYASGNLRPYAGDIYQSMTIETCELSIPTADGDGTLSCTATVINKSVCIGGRRPLGWAASTGPITCAQQQLEGMAVMERVSVTAFIELAAQLEARGAPADLIARCRAAATDEARHVELLVELGAGAPASAPEPAPVTTSLLDIALHNATEGCVTETWAALLVRHQSEHASDPAARHAFAQIAADEARHAQLAWDLHDWLCLQLDAAQVARVEAARSQALAQLGSTALEQAMAVPAEVRQTLGLPDPRAAAALASEFDRRLAAA